LKRSRTARRSRRAKLTSAALKRAPIAGVAVRVLGGIAIAPRAIGATRWRRCMMASDLSRRHAALHRVSTVRQTAALNHGKRDLQEPALRKVMRHYGNLQAPKRITMYTQKESD